MRHVARSMVAWWSEGESLVQLSKIGQRMKVVFLLEIGEAKIELNLTQLRVDAESALIYVDRLPVAMGLGIQDTEISQRAHVARIKFSGLD